MGEDGLQAGVRARERGELAEARRCGEAATAERPDDPRGWVLLASVAHLEGALDEAARVYRRALAAAPGDAAAHAGLAVALAQSGQPATARAHARAAVEAGASGGLPAVPWLRALRQARELAAGGEPREWSRCATPLVRPGRGERIEAPGERGVVGWTVAELARALVDGRRVVALTGAGMSAASGLETRKQLWQRFVRDEAVSAVRFAAEPGTLWAVIRAFWGEGGHRPNAGHLALATLPGLQAIVTQNVDDLHEEAGEATGARVPVIALHGSLSRTRCVGCGRPGGASSQALAAAGPLPPRCACGAVVRPEVVLFGEPVPGEIWAQARRWAEQAELLLVVGCAMDVSPASELPPLAARAGATIVEIKRRPSLLGSMTRVHWVGGVAEDVLPQVQRELARARGG